MTERLRRSPRPPFRHQRPRVGASMTESLSRHLAVTALSFPVMSPPTQGRWCPYLKRDSGDEPFRAPRLMPANAQDVGPLEAPTADLKSPARLQDRCIPFPP